MPLETIIAENTAALKELISVIGRASLTITAPAPAINASASKADVPAESTTTAQPQNAAPATQSEEAPATYSQAAQAVVDLTKAKGRPAGEALLAQFGAVKLPDVPPEKFAEIISAAKKALEE